MRGGGESSTTVTPLDRYPFAIDLDPERIKRISEVYRLSPEETEILPLLLTIRDTKIIAHTTNISEYTLKAHLKSIYRKLDVDDRLGLMAKLLGQSPIATLNNGTLSVEPKEKVIQPYGLWQREIEVLQLLVKGYTNYQIAQQLDLSESTIRNYLIFISDKLKVEERGRGVRQRIAAKAKELGLVSEMEGVQDSTIKKLTSAELKLLNKMAEKPGISNKELGIIFGLAEQTVKNELMSAFDKLGCDTRHEAVVFFERFKKARLV